MGLPRNGAGVDVCSLSTIDGFGQIIIYLHRKSTVKDNSAQLYYIDIIIMFAHRRRRCSQKLNPYTRYPVVGISVGRASSVALTFVLLTRRPSPPPPQLHPSRRVRRRVVCVSSLQSLRFRRADRVIYLINYTRYIRTHTRTHTPTHPHTHTHYTYTYTYIYLQLAYIVVVVVVGHAVAMTTRPRADSCFKSRLRRRVIIF